MHEHRSRYDTRLARRSTYVDCDAAKRTGLSATNSIAICSIASVERR